MSDYEKIALALMVLGIVVGVTGVAVLVALARALAAPAPEPEPEPEPDRPDFYGFAVDYRDADSIGAAFTLTDRHIGPARNIRVYDDGRGWAKIRDRCLNELPTDRTVVVSSRSEQADGPDGYIRVLNDIAASRTGGATVWANWNHEHDAAIQDGSLTLADYLARAETFHGTVKANCPGVQVAQIVMWWTFRDDVAGLHPDRLKSLSPAVCDAYGVDFYNKTDGGSGGPINTAVPSTDGDGRAFTAFIARARADGVPWMVNEFNWDWDEVDATGTNTQAHQQWTEWAVNLLHYCRTQPDCVLVQFFNYTSRQNGRSLVATRQTEPSKVIPLLPENTLEHAALSRFAGSIPGRTA